MTAQAPCPHGYFNYCSVCGSLTTVTLAEDPTEDIRRALIELGIPADDLAAVVASGGQTWNTAQLTAEFEVIGFMAPFVVARRLSDGVKGSLEFTHHPRFYFGWRPHSR